jgi:hypothetical protein
VVAETQSIDLGVRVPPESARNAGVFSVAAFPPSVDSATATLPVLSVPAAQQTEVQTQEIELNVTSASHWPV